MSDNKRKTFSSAQKAKVALEAIKGLKTINQIAQEYNVHPTQVNQWKKELLANAGELFDIKRGPKPIDAQSDPDRLYAKMVNSIWSLIGSKKIWDRPVTERQQWVEIDQSIALTKQCALLNINRSVIYQQQKQKHNQCEIDARDQLVLQLIDEEYTRQPFFGSRRMQVYLRRLGHRINRKRVQRLMKVLGLEGMAPGPNTSKAHPQHKVYPYLLRGLDIVRPNHVWSTDITYIRLPRGFEYLVAIID